MRNQPVGALLRAFTGFFSASQANGSPCLGWSDARSSKPRTLPFALPRQRFGQTGQRASAFRELIQSLAKGRLRDRRLARFERLAAEHFVDGPRIPGGLGVAQGALDPAGFLKKRECFRLLLSS